MLRINVDATAFAEGSEDDESVLFASSVVVDAEDWGGGRLIWILIDRGKARLEVVAEFATEHVGKRARSEEGIGEVDDNVMDDPVELFDKRCFGGDEEES